MPDHLVIERLTKSYESAPVLREVSLRADPGDTIAIVGPSGAGKSTLLHIVGALEKPTSGRLCLGDVDVVALEGPAAAAFRAARVGFVFQEHYLLPQLTAIENTMLPVLALPASKRAGARQRAQELLDSVGLGGKAGSYPAHLSGGERQRVAVARAIMNAPGLLLCDEPTGNLDSESGAAAVALLLRLAESSGTSVLMATHNVAHAARMSRCVALTDGRLVEPGG
jgi:ABC-type lipoprotein export system ATPase subunit